MLVRRLAVVLLWVIGLAALWLVIASGAFLWLAGLWDNEMIPWWSRPYQWAVYALYGDGSFSELLYLTVAAIVASAPGLLCVRFGLFSQVVGRQQQAVYGKTDWANRKEMSSNSISTHGKPF